MSLIRTDEQVDAQEILKLTIKTAEFYREMGESLSKDNVDHSLFEIAKQRESFIAPLESAVEALHEYPTAPDADKEFVDELSGKVSKLFSDDSKSAIFDKCLKHDEALADRINSIVLSEQSTELKRILDSLNAHLLNTKADLKSSSRLG